jgi:periplasmic protein TonB
MERTFISTGERIRNYLGVGLLLSLMLNAFVTPLYPNLTSPHIYVKPDIFSITHPATVNTPPKPTPPPRHQTASHPRIAKPIAVHPPVTQATSGPAEPPYVPPRITVSGGILGPTGVAPTSGATTGAATTGPLCPNPNEDAYVINAMSPMYPDSARDFGLGKVTVLVQVTLDAQGRLLDTKISQSSNNAAIDRSALRAARQTTYAPRIANCVPVEGTYIFRADFEPN